MVRRQIAHHVRSTCAPQERFDLLDVRGIPVAMALSDNIGLAHCLEFDRGQLPDRLQHRPALGKIWVGNQQRRTGETAKTGRQVLIGPGRAPAHSHHGLGGHTRGERREPGEEEALGLFEQIEAPFQGGPKRLMTLGCGSPPSSEESEAVIKPGQYAR